MNDDAPSKEDLMAMDQMEPGYSRGVDRWILIPLKPMPKKRPVVTRSKGTFMPKAYVQWKEQFAWHLRAAGIRSPIDGEFRLEVIFDFAKLGIGDIDNLVGAVLDAGNRIAWVDDKLCSALDAVIFRNTGIDQVRIDFWKVS